MPSVLSAGNDKRWGYQVGDETGALRGVKLLLDESKQVRYQPAIKSKRIIEDMNSTPVQVAGDYLTFLASHAREILDRRFGSALPAIQLEYDLTVPAVWSDKAKRRHMTGSMLSGYSTIKGSPIIRA